MAARLARPVSIFKLILISAALLCVLPAIASAYTIVMRDGRKIQIPDDFGVDRATLTYRVSDTIQITLQLGTINIAATEKLNGEAPGSLLQHRIQQVTTAQSVSTTPQTPMSARRSVTNLELENFRRARVENERKYEERRKELGLPKVEEQRRNLAAVGERAGEEARNIRSQEAQAESYWRNRADALRNEISATNARIAYIQARLNGIPANVYGPFGTILPFATVDQLSIGSPFITGTVATSVGPQFRGRLGFRNDRFRGSVAVNPGFRGVGRSPFISPFPFGTFVSVPFQNYDLGYERSRLIGELDQLMLQRVTLQSHWRDLEDEARRLGAYPGWLRRR